MGAKTQPAGYRKQPVDRLRAAVVTVAMLAALAAAGCEPGPSAGGVLGENFTAETNECFVPAEAEQFGARIVELVNEERSQQGLPPVAGNATLARIAGDYACQMIENDFFDHTNPITGSTIGSRALQYAYYFTKVGENLAGGFTTPEETMSQWMDSPGHRANILDEDFTELGAAVRTGGYYRWYWVQEFGLPR